MEKEQEWGEEEEVEEADKDEESSLEMSELTIRFSPLPLPPTLFFIFPLFSFPHFIFFIPLFPSFFSEIYSPTPFTRRRQGVHWPARTPLPVRPDDDWRGKACNVT